MLMVLESAGIPVPSEIIMPFAGFLVTIGVFNFWTLIFWGTLGNITGSFVLYGFGYVMGRPFIERFGKYALIHSRDIDLVERWFRRWGAWAVFVSRMLPVVRTYISFPAGMARMNVWKFTLFSTIGIIPWILLLAWIGVFLGERWQTAEEYFRRFDILILALLIASVIWWIRRHLKHIRAV